ncbi:hypothetical protein P7C70_g4640, partial [Phenoliferia sp. Uapishka_3]
MSNARPESLRCGFRRFREAQEARKDDIDTRTASRAKVSSQDRTWYQNQCLLPADKQLVDRVTESLGDLTGLSATQLACIDFWIGLDPRPGFVLNSSPQVSPSRPYHPHRLPAAIVHHPLPQTPPQRRTLSEIGTTPCSSAPTEEAQTPPHISPPAPQLTARLSANSYPRNSC